MKDTNRNQITVETWAVEEVNAYLDETAKACGLTRDHLATVLLTDAIDQRRPPERYGIRLRWHDAKVMREEAERRQMSPADLMEEVIKSYARKLTKKSAAETVTR